MYLRGGARYTVQQNPKAKSKVPDYNTFTMGNPMPESTLTLYQSRLYPPVRELGFGLRDFIPPVRDL